jgi:hypothetical protein
MVHEQQSWHVGDDTLRMLWYWNINPDCVWTDARSSTACLAAQTELRETLTRVIQAARNGESPGPAYFDLLVHQPFDPKYLEPMRP